MFSCSSLAFLADIGINNRAGLDVSEAPSSSQILWFFVLQTFFGVMAHPRMKSMGPRGWLHCRFSEKEGKQKRKEGENVGRSSITKNSPHCWVWVCAKAAPSSCGRERAATPTSTLKAQLILIYLLFLLKCYVLILDFLEAKEKFNEKKKKTMILEWMNTLDIWAHFLPVLFLMFVYLSFCPSLQYIPTSFKFCKRKMAQITFPI